MVETALVLPIMLMIILGIVEFGRAFSVSQLLTNAAREGNRMSVLSGVTTQNVIDEVHLLTTSTVGVSSSNVAVQVTVTPFAGGAQHSDLTLAQKRDLVDVRVTVAYQNVSLMPVRWMQGVNLVGQSAMRHE